MMTHVLFAGLSTLDIVYRVAEFPAANTKVAALDQRIYVGGPATNAAIACAHLGGAATLATVAGRHALAGVLRAELAQFSIRLVDLNPEFDGLPAVSSIAVDPAGNRNIVSANAVRIPAAPAEADRSLCAQARLLLVDGHFMSACQAWAAVARACATPVVLDGGSWKSGTEELLKSVDAAICSADFLPPGCASADDVFRFLKNAGVRNVAITRGGEPIRIMSGVTTATVPVPRVDAVDTMGAGDLLHGAYCYFASMGRGFAEALAEAAKIASESCRWPGTREWMRHPIDLSLSHPVERRNGA